MSKKTFTDLEMLDLSKNKYVKNVTSKGITYTNEFKLQFIAEYENGKRTITISHLITLAKYYDVSIDYLVGLSNFKDENKKTNKLA